MLRSMLGYLQREHARLEHLIERERRAKFPNEVLVARLKKLKLAVKDQVAAAEGLGNMSNAA